MPVQALLEGTKLYLFRREVEEATLPGSGRLAGEKLTRSRINCF